MLADRGLPNLVPPHSSTFSRRSTLETGDNVFEEQSSSSSTSRPLPPPLSPRSGKTPGIILTTVEGAEEERPAEVISVYERPGSSGSSSTRSSRRSRQHQTRNSQTHRPQNAQRSPSVTRMRRNGSNHKLREPALMNGVPSGVSRSQSMRTARRPQSVDPSHRFRHRISSIPNDLTLPSNLLDPQRLASNQSLPLPGDEADFLRLRNFAVTPKGLVNRGDSFRSKSRSAHSVASAGSGHLPVQRFASDDSRVLAAVAASAASSGISPASNSAEEVVFKDQLTVEPDVVEGASAITEPARKSVRYRVLVLGPPDVGKTSLTRQFMTSEYICAYDSSVDEDNEKSVQVILNGEESELVFLEHTYTDDSYVDLTAVYGPDAYLIVYSVTNKRTLQTAKDAIRFIKRSDANIETKALIIVGNKTDLARHRVLSADDGRSLAIEEGCKFIETSAGINHHVDELLVGILSQIRLKLSSAEKLLRKRESVSLGSSGKVRTSGKCAGCAGCRAKGILKRILKKACNRSKSCDNLHVL